MAISNAFALCNVICFRGKAIRGSQNRTTDNLALERPGRMPTEAQRAKGALARRAKAVLKLHCSFRRQSSGVFHAG